MDHQVRYSHNLNHYFKLHIRLYLRHVGVTSRRLGGIPTSEFHLLVSFDFSWAYCGVLLSNVQIGVFLL